MFKKNKILKGFITALSISTAALSMQANADAIPTSATILEFTDSNTLFVADADSSKIFAYQLPELAPTKSSEDRKSVV